MNNLDRRFHTNCLICGSDKIKNLNKYIHANLAKCLNCNFIFSLRIPSEVELNKHYTNYPRYENFSDITIKRYHSLLDEFEKFRLNNNILDIGCSNGHFLEVAKQRGWNVFGQEFATECIEVCKSKGIDIKKGYLESCDFKDNFFDVITSFEVIEHINTPVIHVKTIIQKLRNGGIFYFTTPNFNSISRDILNEKWNIIEYPEHLSYYTPSTINQLLTKYGLLKIKIKTTGISLSRIQQSKEKKSHTSSLKDSPDEKYRQKAEKNIFFKLLKSFINFLLNTLKKGDTIKGYYYKP